MLKLETGTYLSFNLYFLLKSFQKTFGKFLEKLPWRILISIKLFIEIKLRRECVPGTLANVSEKLFSLAMNICYPYCSLTIKHITSKWTRGFNTKTFTENKTKKYETCQLRTRNGPKKVSLVTIKDALSN